MTSRPDQLDGKGGAYYPTDEQVSAFDEMYQRWRPGIRVEKSVDHRKNRWRLAAQDGEHPKILVVSLQVLEHDSGAKLVEQVETRFRGYFSEPKRVKKELLYQSGPSWHDRSDVEI